MTEHPTTARPGPVAGDSLVRPYMPPVLDLPEPPGPVERPVPVQAPAPLLAPTPPVARPAARQEPAGRGGGAVSRATLSLAAAVCLLLGGAVYFVTRSAPPPAHPVTAPTPPAVLPGAASGTAPGSAPATAAPATTAAATTAPVPEPVPSASQAPPSPAATPSAAASGPRTTGAAAPSGPRVLTVGDTGPDVTALQDLLFGQGFTYVTRTGRFDEATRRGTAQLQSDRGITGDPSGVYGPNTRAALEGR
ncbi:peptidoglycan-binding protein [Kitasatospora sp. NPDC048540]|uniref:peptidoglycan-binding protein n=1 Tax=Kitasatospora sp. NPDC048540 TaxID=3155634 RepID=UPI0033BFFE2A